ncbi:MAG: putative DNA-binding protein (MmcQ/YjbR family) [Akkermansiaceae bacterium]|jgi:predicted DNA-binding protein (MmcQ/YjbR family)
MNKKHWNTLVLEGSLGEKLVVELMEHSYGLVVNGMTKKLREELVK